jgi:phage baseplate assembly protein W
MATTRFLSREDGTLGESSIITSRAKLFRDLDLTFTAKPNGEIFIKKDAAAVKQAVKNLVLTNYFEKPFQPFYGADVTGLLFELADDETGEEVRENIIRAIETYEPRANIIDVLVNSRPDFNSLEVTIEFQVVNTEEIVTFTTVISRLR